MTETEELKEAANAPFDPKPLRSIYEIVQNLSKPIPAKFLKTRKQGGKDITYIAWHDATKLLDYYANGWCYEIREVMNIAGSICITVRLHIPAEEGVIFRDATGFEKDDDFGYGDPFSNAESMALRRAAVKFGLGRHLYSPDSNSAHVSQNRQYNQDRQSNPPPSQSSNQQQSNRTPPTGNRQGLGTEKQINYLESLCHKAGQSEIDVCQQFSDGRVETYDQLTMSEIKAAIEYMKQ